MNPKIEWGEPVDRGGPTPWMETRGHIGELHVATVFPDRSKKGDMWWVTVHLAPLPHKLDQMTVVSKKGERQARATAQRVVNAFVRLLAGEAAERPPRSPRDPGLKEMIKVDRAYWDDKYAGD